MEQRFVERSNYIPAVMDIEASGFGSRSYPVEVGCILEDGKRYCSLIKPMPQWQHWEQEAEDLHGLTRDQLVSSGKSPKLVCEDLNQLLKGKTLYSDGWVVDQPWLITLYSAAGMSMSFKLSPLEMILSEPQMAIWKQVKTELSRIRAEKRHRASADAALVQRVFLETLNTASRKVC